MSTAPIAATEALTDTLVTPLEGDRRPLGSYAAGESLLVYFLRTFDCPICRAHVRALSERHQELSALGARIVVVGPGEREGAAALVAREPGLPFPVVADTTGDAYRAARLRKALFGTVQQSGFVLLGLDGTPRLEHAATVPLDALDLGAILRSLRVPQSVRHDAS